MQSVSASGLRYFRSVALCAVIFFAAVPLCFPQELSFDQRVACRQALEAVHWDNRIWPTSSGRAKPSLHEVMPRSAIAAAVQDDLRKSAALQRFWNRPMSGEQLQAEIDRMARQSREPVVLRRLFAALGDDPLMVAECLARPLLTERLLRNWYAGDERFHGGLRGRIENELIRSGRAAAAMDQLTGAYSELEWIRIGPNGGPAAGVEEQRNVRRLEATEWDRMLEQLGVVLEDDALVAVELSRGALPNSQASGLRFEALDAPVQLETLPLGRMSRLIERDDRFLVTAVLSRGVDRLMVASVTWRKQPFDAWWDDAALQVGSQIEAVNFPYVLPDADYSPCQGDSWILTNTLAPLNRSDHTAVWTGAEMIVWGGYGGFYLDTGGLYSPATDHWVPTSTTNAPIGRFRHTAVWTGTEMIVWGGQTGSGAAGYADTGGRYSPLTDSWSATSTASAPVGRIFHTGVWTGTRMVIWGGTNGADLDTGGIYDPGGNSWTATTATDAPAPRYRHTAIWSGSQMIVWGGLGAGSALDSGARLDPGTNVWTAMSTVAVPSAREYHTAVWDDNDSQMIVWGGRNGSYLNSGGRYDPALNSWSATTTSGAPAGRRSHTAIWDDTDNRMIVWGGFDGSFEDTGGRYDPATDGWTSTQTSGAPIPRYLHSAVWTGTEMIVWGGSDGGRMSSGGRYDAVGDSWVPTANSQSPWLRYAHTALWTGAEMVVWGGAGAAPGGVEMDSGGRYNPATNSWLPTSFTDAPLARESHSAVWTGSEMIVWGGYAGQSGVAYDDGARYNPVTDGWTAISTTGAPAARSDHVAVWADDRMIVWGGESAVPADLDSGGEYLPGGDSWSPTSTTGAPSARTGHAAIWTGTEMIVWGGSAAGVELDTGAGYSPLGGSWTALPAVGAPAARAHHTAIWTGTEMIVWGGFGGPSPGALLDSGGRYDPALVGWQPTATVSAPTPRQNHTAAWTGYEMLVWGGSGMSGELDSGGRYLPGDDSWQAMSVADVPPARDRHTAVWTGTRMVIWGGLPAEVLGGAYCACIDMSCIPAVALDLSFSGTVTLQWTATPGVPVYNLYRGTLPAGGWSYDHACQDPGLTVPVATDTDEPAIGTGYYYLVSGVGALGEGSLGLASDTSPRPNNSPCP